MVQVHITLTEEILIERMLGNRQSGMTRLLE